VRFLSKRLESAVVVRSEEREQSNEVRFGAMVDIVDENGKRSRFQVVGPDEADPNSGRISFESPFGKSLMKRRVGDVIVVQRPAGEIEVEILAIEY
jgi:transcription elongation factor GreB